MIQLILFFGLAITADCLPKSLVDETIKQHSTGQNVVAATIAKIRTLSVFNHDFEFMNRIAKVETNFGQLMSTFSTDDYGGIWNLNKSSLALTQDTKSYPFLKKYHIFLQFKHGISWNRVKNEDLAIPLISGLAARLLLHIHENTNNQPLPGSLEDQERIWKGYYSNNGGNSAMTFSQAANVIEKSFSSSKEADECFIVDGSESIGNFNFSYAKTTIKDIITDSDSRFCVVVFSNTAETIIKLTDSQDKNDLLSIIDKMAYPSQRTATPLGILKGVSEMNAVSDPAPERFIHVITDGGSNENMDLWEQALDAIKPFNRLAFGLGPDINDDELVKIGGKIDNVGELYNYNTLSQITFYIRKSVHETSKNLQLGQSYEFKVRKNESRYMNYNSNGPINIKIDKKLGSYRAFYSFSFKNPSESLNDGSFTDVKSLDHQGTIYVTIEGLDDNNSVTIVFN